MSLHVWGLRCCLLLQVIEEDPEVLEQEPPEEQEDAVEDSVSEVGGFIPAKT